MKTIAIVINTSWNIVNFRMGLLRTFQKEGYQVVAIAPEDDYSKKFAEIRVKYFNININNKGTNPFEELRLLYDFYQLYKKISPDILLHYTIKPNIYGTLAARLLNIPVISNISGLGTVFLNDSLSSKIARLLYKFALQFPKKVFYQNHHDRELFIKSGLVTLDKTDILPGSGINTDQFRPSSKTIVTNNSFKFLFIARLIKDKGLVEYYEAAKLIKKSYANAEFNILGSFYPGNPTAISKDVMNDWVKEGIINYLGTSNNVSSIIAKADCIVLPSYREGMSRVLLEAASMAKPIVTTNVPGCKEVVDHGVNGFLCQVKDSIDLADKMKKILNLSEDQRVDMGKKGREKVLIEFDERLVIDKYLHIIEEVLY